VVIHVLFDASSRYSVVGGTQFIHDIYQLYSVSDLIGPSSGASYKVYERIGK
jgi:hypothetical protein